MHNRPLPKNIAMMQ